MDGGFCRELRCGFGLLVGAHMRGDAHVATGDVALQLDPVHPCLLQCQPSDPGQLVAGVFQHAGKARAQGVWALREDEAERAGGPSVAHFFLMAHCEDDDGFRVNAVAGHIAAVAEVDDPLPKFVGHVLVGRPMPG